MGSSNDSAFDAAANDSGALQKLRASMLDKDGAFSVYNAGRVAKIDARLKQLTADQAAAPSAAPDLLDTANTAGALAKRRQQMQAGSGLDSTFLGTPNAGKTT